MSYILDALKKSQQEREAASEQSASAVVALPSARTGKAASLVVTVGLTVSLVIVLLALWLTRSNTASPVEPAVALMQERTMEEKTVAAKAVAAINTTEDKLQNKQKQGEQKGLKKEVASQTRAKVEERQLPPLDSLRKIPALMINSHIYSGIASKRSVTINNQRQREGDYLTSDIFLQEITAQGIIIEVDGWPLSISRQQGWQPIPEGN